MTNFEHMKEKVLEIVSALDETGLRQLVSDNCMGNSGTNGVWSCALCEEVYGDCGIVSNDCQDKYLNWCNREYNPELVWEDKTDIVDKLSDLLKVTRIGSDIDKLVLSEDKHIVTIKYRHDAKKRVNIECDSGYAIIRDILAVLQ